MGIGYILPSVLLKLFHPVSDADMARIIKENAESENYEALEDQKKEVGGIKNVSNIKRNFK